MAAIFAAICAALPAEGEGAFMEDSGADKVSVHELYAKTVPFRGTVRHFFAENQAEEKMVSPRGIEPPAFPLGGERSIRLSYGDILKEKKFADKPGSVVGNHLSSSSVTK